MIEQNLERDLQSWFWDEVGGVPAPARLYAALPEITDAYRPGLFTNRRALVLLVAAIAATVLAAGAIVVGAGLLRLPWVPNPMPMPEPTPVVTATPVAAATCAPGSGTIITVAGVPLDPLVDGGAVRTSSGDGGLAVDAHLQYPVDVAVDAAGNLYILDRGEDPAYVGRVRRVDLAGVITTVVGPPAGAAAAPGAAGDLQLSVALAMVLDGDGNIYLGGQQFHTVTRVSPAGDVTVVAGTGVAGYGGDGGPALEAQFNLIAGLAFDPAGNLYIAEIMNNRVRRVDPSGIVTTFAGTGVAGFSGDSGLAVEAQLNGPSSVEVDAAGNVYIADMNNGRIRRVDPAGIIESVAGNGEFEPIGDGGLATEAGFLAQNFTLDRDGSLVLTDYAHDRIRRVDADGVITTIAGSGARGFSGDGGPAVEALLNEPAGVTIGSDGALYIADFRNAVVRKICL